MSFSFFIIQTRFPSFQYQFQFCKFALNSLFYLVNEDGAVMLDSHLGNKRDIFYLNNKNNQLKRRVRPPRDIY